ncbi:hypothetical protein PL321_06105 [Caloramator sp. mosi_1]|uniref:hypothetical protein n=1 Tax=Caloramator sp. mosi_1 TaxID=3023090 RepID=UPI002362B0C3|nr:hypothetical protein [Caloramator sp. mosi_1]WDC85084.1 hypothetical protein PL321_06105 [Caloramator sp. mosi_1]
MFDCEDYYEYLYTALIDIKNKYIQGQNKTSSYLKTDYKVRMNMRKAYYSKRREFL